MWWKARSLRYGSARRQQNDLSASTVLRPSSGSSSRWRKKRFRRLDAPHLLKDVFEERKFRTESPSYPINGRSQPEPFTHLLTQPLEIKRNCVLVSPMTVERVVNKQVPFETWKGSYNMVPIPADDLRRELMAMTTDGGPNDVAARYLTEIDEIRDTWGAPESERRHPDIASGRAWPTMPSH